MTLNNISKNRINKQINLYLNGNSNKDLEKIFLNECFKSIVFGITIVL